jgi:uncharacterized membrane protein
MEKDKHIKRSGVRKVERSAEERRGFGRIGAASLHRLLTGGERAPRRAPRSRRGLWRSVRSSVATALYKLSGELAGLSEERPALGRRILAKALTTLGVKAPRVAVSVTIGKSREEVLGELRGFAEMRRFLRSIERVEIAKERDTALFTFRDDAGKARTGLLSFATAPGGQGTEVEAVLAGTVSTGRIARAVARLLAEAPRERLCGDLRRIEQWMETGEIPTIVGQPSGREGD